MSDEIDIRLIQSQADFDACEDIQLAAWQSSADVVPGHLLRAVQKSGGLVIGAFTPQDGLVGFVFSLISLIFDERRRQIAGSRHAHYSDMMGVRPDYHNRSIGTRLKWAQRQHVLDWGYRLITWTYDPLLGPNAYLNVVHLGVTCCHYIRDAYGQLDGIYAGLNTDRFEVEWWLDSPRVRARAGQPTSPPLLDDWLDKGAWVVNSTTINHDGLVQPHAIIDFPPGPLLVEVPADFNAIRAADMALARDWRQHTREVFEAAFERGYVVTEFIRAGDRSYYGLKPDNED